MSKAVFSCLQIPYYLCSHILLELEGEDLAAAGLGCLSLGQPWRPCSDCLFFCVLGGVSLEAAQSSVPGFSPAPL